ncbi:type I polyketide synthase, partial [Amycolatopsis sp. NPDC058278]|uniref:type I polyketide synthase n=1 Tax=Amycolatopsis sp. NPDC058278 TaxID=3346417 RepID=UPI0036DEF2B3
LRRYEGTLTRFLTSAATAHTHGQEIDWAAVFGPDARRVDLPTYPFERQRYWLDAPARSGDVTAAGLGSAGHPLLGAAVELADGAGVVFAALLSPDTHPWLADHAFAGTVLLPGTAFLELALHAGHQVGCPQVADLTLEAPLPLGSAVSLQLFVGEADAADRRPISVYSRPTGDTGSWTRHATGLLTGETTAPEPPSGAWPPPGAVPFDLTGAYERLAGQGYEYGPAFRCLRAVWRRGDEVYADVRLPDGVEPRGFGLHPALFDAALHPLVLGALGETEPDLLPFSWSGASLHAVGAPALRVRLSRAADGTVGITATDPAGTLVSTVDALLLRPVARERLTAAPRSLYRVEWSAVSPETTTDWALLDEFGGEHTAVLVPPAADGDVPVRAHEITRQTVRQLQEWLADDRFAKTHLVVVTREAVGLGGKADLATAPLWGLVRSAQAEHPGRISLLDVDTDVPAALPLGHPQLALRDGTAYAPRLVPAVPGEPTVLDPDGTVLITGAGTLGRLLARHLVTEHGVRHVVLASRRGTGTDLGPDAGVTAVACDVSDREALVRLLGTIPAEHPLTAVVHTAGVLEDATVDNLTAEQLDAVLRPKVDAAWQLSELTGVPLILFSSAAGVLGTPGQAGYAAANTFLDALAHNEPRIRSLAWGLWNPATGMTAHLDTADRVRLARTGLAPMSAEEGLALFDAALRTPDSLLVPASLDTAALSSADAVNPLLRGLVRTPVRRAVAAGPGSGTALTDKLAGRPEPEQRQLLLRLVRSTAAAVLAHPDPDAVSAGQAFRTLGFDSLTAVELRNRLAAATSLSLPASLIFDHPTPTALAEHLRGKLLGG